VVIIKLEIEEIKKEVMKNKYKLKGDKIFIENDLRNDLGKREKYKGK